MSGKKASREPDLLDSAECSLATWLKKMREEQEKFKEEKERLQKWEADLSKRESSLQIKEKELITEAEKYKRMASNAARKQGSIIGPKEPTHEDLRRSFVDYFTKKLRQHKRLNISKQIGSTIVKEAYRQCRGKIVELLTKEVLAMLEYTPSRDAGLQQSVQEKETFTDRSRAYAMLLHTSGARQSDCQQELFIKVTENLIKSCQEFEQALGGRDSHDAIQSLVSGAVTIAWNMVTLTPPALLWEPPMYSEHWHDKQSKAEWKVEAGEHFDLVYFRPVLLYGADGTLGHRGSVGCKVHVDGINKAEATAESHPEDSPDLDEKYDSKKACCMCNRAMKKEEVSLYIPQNSTFQVCHSTCAKCGCCNARIQPHGYIFENLMCCLKCCICHGCKKLGDPHQVIKDINGNVWHDQCWTYYHSSRR